MGALISREFRRIPLRFVALGVAVLALSCGGREDAPEERTVFLTNLPRAQVSVGGTRPYDLHHAQSSDVSLRGVALGFDTRRAIVQRPGVELRFHDVPLAGAVLQTAVLPRGPAADSTATSETFSMEIVAQASEGRRVVVWQAEFAAPSDESTRHWEEIRVPLPTGLGEKGDLLFRSSCMSDRSPELGDVPVWSNPKLSIRKSRRPRAGSSNRNVIVFLVDTLRQDHLGTYGYERATSPNLDLVAEESLVFDAAHAAAPWTKASVATLFTSQPPSLHGAENYQDRLGNTAVTLAETLQAAGYRTAAIGYNGWVFNAKFNLLQGFGDDFHVLDVQREGGARADSVVAESIDWLESNGNEPFFLYIHTIDPHEPYVPTPELRSRFQRQAYSGDLTGRLEGPGTHSNRTREQVSKADLDFLHDLYDAEIRFADERLGELIAYLKKRGLWEETTLVVTADHGEEFLEHGAWTHGGSVYQEQILVPLVIKPPASMRIPPTRIAEPVGLVDLAPTICSFAGVPAQDLPFFGQNLIPLAMAPGLWKQRVVLSELNKEGRHIVGLRHGARKYIRSLAPREQEFLFDLHADPVEQENLIAVAEEDELGSFRTILNAHLGRAARSGLVVEILSDGTQAHVLLNVKTESGQLDYGLVDCEREGDRFRRRSSQDHLFEFRLDADDRRDGVRLHLSAEDDATLTLLVRQRATDASRILLGPDQSPATSAELRLSDLDESLWVSEPPVWNGRPGLWCRIWNLRPQRVVLDENEILELKALGYFGD